MRLRGLVWGVVLSGALWAGILMLLAGCVVQPSGRYQSDPNHYPYYRAIEEPPPSTPEEGGLKGPRYLSGTSANIYDGTHYREGGVRMGNRINYPDGRVEFVRE